MGLQPEMDLSPCEKHSLGHSKMADLQESITLAVESASGCRQHTGWGWLSRAFSLRVLLLSLALEPHPEYQLRSCILEQHWGHLDADDPSWPWPLWWSLFCRWENVHSWTEARFVPRFSVTTSLAFFSCCWNLLHSKCISFEAR